MTLVLLPTQLHYEKKLLDFIKERKISLIILYEEPKFFTAFKYHSLKLIYHRATLKTYYKWLMQNLPHNVHTKYVEFHHSSPLRNSTEVYVIDPLDREIENKYHEELKKYSTKYHIVDSLHFTLTRKDILKNADHFSHIVNGHRILNHESFYKWQRIRLRVLVTKDNKPLHGKWSFDTENRESLPSNASVPSVLLNNDRVHQTTIKEAVEYVEKHFSSNYGYRTSHDGQSHDGQSHDGQSSTIPYPIDRIGSLKWLDKFCKERLAKFGKYEDASRKGEPFLYHSVLTPMLNVGLLSDWDVLEHVLGHAKKASVPKQSLEGFIRQLIGWRNYMYADYVLNPNLDRLIHGGPFQNNLHFTSGAYQKWWEGTTGLDPIDDIIRTKIIPYAYTHHIERLMYLGAVMLMAGVHPGQVYRMFMEWTIDAYEWVMIPNIYGMSQFADGGLTMKRPYFSSSAYITRMSNYGASKSAAHHIESHSQTEKQKPSSGWQEKWDALYWVFLDKHRKYFKKNYAYASHIAQFDAFTPARKTQLRQLASETIKDLTGH